MADSTTPKKQPDNEQAVAEKHVSEIMGPTQDANASAKVQKPEAETTKAPVADTALPSAPIVAEEPAAMPEPDFAMSQATDETISGKTDAIVPENDLDMDKLPTDFTTDTDEDADTAAAVDDIVYKDADATLDEPKAHATVMKPSFTERIKNAWYDWWGNPRKRYGTLAIVIVLGAVIGFVPAVRAMVLNTAGVRSSMIVHVMDGGTDLPLQNVVVRADGVVGKTDYDGKVQLRGVHIGSHKVDVQKLGFKAVSRQVTFGLNIADLGEIKLQPTGQQIAYSFTDYMTGKPITGVSISSDDATTKSDKLGKALLTTAPGNTEKITIKKEGYRTESLDHPAPEAPAALVKLVPSAQAVFISKESGTYDVYKAYLDGKDRKVLFEGTGLETQSIAALPSPDGKKVAVASTRDDKRNKDGFLLTAINIVDTETGDSTNIEYAEQVVLLGWRNSTLVYSQTVAGTSAANPNRQKIISYDLTANKRFQLASANYFAGQELIGDTLYYTVSATDPSAQETFAKVNVDGSAKKTLFSGNVWTLLRSDYNKLKLQGPDKWYEYTTGASAPVESTPVSDYTSRYYVDSPGGSVSARVDVRDNKGVLMLRTVADGKEKELVTQRNMQSPSYWLNDSVIVYRIAGATEVADYAVDIHGGDSKKIADVSLTGVR